MKLEEKCFEKKGEKLSNEIINVITHFSDRFFMPNKKTKWKFGFSDKFFMPNKKIKWKFGFSNRFFILNKKMDLKNHFSDKFFPKFIIFLWFPAIFNGFLQCFSIL